MKIKSLLMAATAAITSVSSVYADATIYVTGATAFRASALSAIARSFTGNVNCGFTGNNFGNANQSTFIGTFPGISGTTTIQTSWNGSIEGLRAISQPGVTNVSYLPTGATSLLSFTPTTITGGTSGRSAASLVPRLNNKIAFSDVSEDITPFSANTFSGGQIGVVTFIPLVNRGANANITNLNSNQHRGLMGSGFAPLGNITGVQADIEAGSDFVFWTGRNDGSGTRSVYTVVPQYFDKGNVRANYQALSQYRIQTATANNVTTNTAIRLWPALDGNNTSNVFFGSGIVGNGGYSSGSALRDAFTRTLPNPLQVQDENGAELFTAPVSLITVIATEDAGAAIGNTTGNVNGLGISTTARALSYDGVTITPITAAGGGLSAADKLKVANGAYTLWAYQNLYGASLSAGVSGEATGAEYTTFFNTLFTNVQTAQNIGGNGLTLGEMSVTRGADGSTISDL